MATRDDWNRLGQRLEGMGYPQSPAAPPSPNSFGDAVASIRSQPRSTFGSLAAQAATLPAVPAPPKPPAQLPPALSAQAQADRASIGAAWDKAKDINSDVGNAIADVATMVPRGLVGAYDSAVVRPMRAAGINADYLSPHLVPDGVDPSSMTPFTDRKRMQQAAQQAPGQQPLPAGVTPSTAGAGRGSINPPMADSKPRGFAPAAAADSTAGVTAPASAVTSNVTRVGNSYSGANIGGDITINGQAPRNGGQVSAQNMAAADGLAARALSQPSAAPSAGAGMSLAQAAGVTPGGGPGSGPVAPGSFTGGFSGVIGQQSGNGNMWSRTPEQQRRDAEVQASSIHRPTAAIGASALRGLDAQALEGVRGRNSLAQAALNADAALQRTGMEQQGANQRSLARAALEQQKINQAGVTQGIANRGKTLLQGLQEQIATEQDPAKRQSLVQRLREMQGATPQQEDLRKYFMETGGGQEWNDKAGAMQQVPKGLVDLRTMQRVGAGRDAAPGGGLPAGMVKQVGASGGKPVYEDERGNRFSAG